MAEWSPFYCLAKAALTPSGLLQLDTADNEVELIRRPQVELRHDGLDPMAPCPREVKNGYWTNRTSAPLTLTITTHRIVLNTSSTNDNTHSTRFIHLSNVHAIQPTGGPSFQHPRATYKIVVSTYTYGDLVLVFLQSGKENRDATLQQLEKALSRKQWEVAARLEEKRKSQQQQTQRRVGVDHIMTKHRLRHEQASKLAEDALSGDAEQLLQQAGELLQVIQRYTVLLQKYNSSSNKEENDDDAARRLAGLLSDMGMTSALTKSQMTNTSGGGRANLGWGRGNSNASSASMNPGMRDYYELTARQIADFLLPRFAEQQKQNTRTTTTATVAGGGIMSLTDVYCLFNRARGTNLISPEDMRQACALLGELNVGLSQRVFPSGIIVIEHDKLSLKNNKEKIVQLCPTTALEASHTLKLSPLLALEQLEEAERLGLVCRDVTPEIVRFFPNKFLTEDW